MLRVMRQFFSLPSNEFSDDEILHICGVLFVNSHEVPVTANPVQVNITFPNLTLLNLPNSLSLGKLKENHVQEFCLK